MPDQRHCSSLYSNSMQYVRCTVIELHAGCQMWQYLHCTVIELHGPSCDSMYIVQLLYCRVLAVTVFTLYSCWTTGSQLWEYVHYTVIVPAVTVCTLYSHCTVGSQLWRKCLLLYSYCTAGPQLLRRCMYIIQLLYCRVPAVREVYAHYIVIVLQGPSCEGGVCTESCLNKGRCIEEYNQFKFKQNLHLLKINLIPLRYPGCSNFNWWIKHWSSNLGLTKLQTKVPNRHLWTVIEIFKPKSLKIMKLIIIRHVWCQNHSQIRVSSILTSCIGIWNSCLLNKIIFWFLWLYWKIIFSFHPIAFWNK